MAIRILPATFDPAVDKTADEAEVNRRIALALGEKWQQRLDSLTLAIMDDDTDDLVLGSYAEDLKERGPAWLLRLFCVDKPDRWPLFIRMFVQELADRGHGDTPIVWRQVPTEACMSATDGAKLKTYSEANLTSLDGPNLDMETFQTTANEVLARGIPTPRARRIP